MKNRLPETDEEQAMLNLLKDLYGRDVLSFKLTGSEVVEAMVIAMGFSKNESPKGESK